MTKNQRQAARARLRTDPEMKRDALYHKLFIRLLLTQELPDVPKYRKLYHRAKNEVLASRKGQKL